MSALSNAEHQLSAANPLPPAATTRLSLKPDGSSRGVLDGAWWPRSTEPAIELPALAEAFAVLRAPVRRIALNLAGWDSAPRRIRLGNGRNVAVDWFQTSGVHLVRIVDTDHSRIDLLIVPADAEPAIGELALATATDGRDPAPTPADPADQIDVTRTRQQGAPS